MWWFKSMSGCRLYSSWASALQLWWMRGESCSTGDRKWTSTLGFALVSSLILFRTFPQQRRLIPVCLYWVCDLPLSLSITLFFSLSLAHTHTHTPHFDPFRLWFSRQDYHWHRVDEANLGRWHTARISHALSFFSFILSSCRAVVKTQMLKMCCSSGIGRSNSHGPVPQVRVVNMLRPERGRVRHLHACLHMWFEARAPSGCARASSLMPC